MSAFRRPLLLLAFLAPFGEMATSSSGVFEVDLVFPRNGTYAQGNVIPVVFAVQNPTLGHPLNAYFNWNVTSLTGDQVYSGHQIPLNEIGSDAGNPYFATDYIPLFQDPAQTWLFTWIWGYQNCTDGMPTPSVGAGQKSLVYTTNNSAPAPDLVGATAADTCASTENLALDIVGLDTKYNREWNHVGLTPASCAILAVGSTPTPNPCAVTIDASAASSLSAAATASICAVAEAPADVNCSAYPFTTMTMTTATATATASPTSKSSAAAAVSVRPSIGSTVGLLLISTVTLMTTLAML